MLENVNYGTSTNISNDVTRINSSSVQKSPAFKGNPNAVDNTPAAYTYQRPTQELPPETGFLDTYTKYGLPTGLALYYSTNLFNWANKGDYEKSLVGRLGKLGDRISNSSVLRNSVVDKIKSNGSAIKRNINDFIDRHPMLKTMKDSPTKPENSFVTGFLETQKEADIKESSKNLFKYIEKGPKTLKEAGATDAEIAALKQKYGTGLFGRIKNLKAALREFEISKMGFDPATIPASEPMKNVRLSHMGWSLGDYNLIKQNPEKYAHHIESGFEKTKGLSSRLSVYYNKLKSINAPKTKLGRFLPKAAKLGMRGLTFGGGLFNCLFMLGLFLGEATKTTIEAPDDKKLSTGVHGLFDAMSWVVAMPIAIKAMHSINGLKNLGKSKAQVSAINRARESFNKKVKAGRLTDEVRYNSKLAALNRIKESNAGTKPKGIKGLISKAAKFLSIGLEQTASYKEKTEKLNWGKNFSKWATGKNFAAIGRNIRRSLPNFARNCAGYPLRFALYMFAFEPIVDKLFEVPLNALFGKPYDPEKIREEHEKYNQHVEELRAMRGPSIPQIYGAYKNPDAVLGLDNANENDLSDDNLIKQRLAEMNALPPKKQNTDVKPQAESNTQDVQNVNGVSISTLTDQKPFMPNDNSLTPNGTANGANKSNDPNVSDYDTVKRDYIPELKTMDVPYPDPYMVQNYDKNYNAMNELYSKMDKAEQDAMKTINSKGLE